MQLFTPRLATRNSPTLNNSSTIIRFASFLFFQSPKRYGKICLNIEKHYLRNLTSWSFVVYTHSMVENTKESIIGNYLASALDIEDSMSLDVYGTYLSRSAWPAHMDNEVFENIKKLLAVVVEETEGHKIAFSELQKKLNASTPGI